MTDLQIPMYDPTRPELDPVVKVKVDDDQILLVDIIKIH
jgi:hypothetical protein